MKFILLSDIQATSKNPVARQDDILQAFFKKFNHVVRHAQNHNIPILQAGDFFDRPRDWYLLFKLMTRLKKWDVEIYSVFGQHDMYLYADRATTPTSLGVLAKAGLVTILNTKPEKFFDSEHSIYIYGCSLGEGIPSAKGDINILVIHAPISDTPLWEGHEYTKAHRVAQQHSDYDLILCGDIHRHFIHTARRTVRGSRNTTIVNTGPLLRHEATEYNYTHQPCYYVYDTTTKEVEPYMIPVRPAAEVLSSTHLESKKHIDEILSELISSLKEMPNVTTNIEDNIRRRIEEDDIDNAVKKIIAKEMANDQDA